MLGAHPRRDGSLHQHERRRHTGGRSILRVIGLEVRSAGASLTSAIVDHGSLDIEDSTITCTATNCYVLKIIAGSVPAILSPAHDASPVLRDLPVPREETSQAHVRRTADRRTGCPRRGRRVSQVREMSRHRSWRAACCEVSAW
ncbi:MAG: hypothetical protein M3619_20705 [Myxococcota bacterium]|nr:hypothetical protein [Myxococcota bacterium]